MPRGACRASAAERTDLDAVVPGAVLDLVHGQLLVPGVTELVEGDVLLGRLDLLPEVGGAAGHLAAVGRHDRLDRLDDRPGRVVGVTAVDRVRSRVAGRV